MVILFFEYLFIFFSLFAKNFFFFPLDVFFFHPQYPQQKTLSRLRFHCPRKKQNFIGQLMLFGQSGLAHSVAVVIPGPGTSPGSPPHPQTAGTRTHKRTQVLLATD